MLEKGALGLFGVGQAQFVTLAREARAIADWLTAREAKSVALVESPIGNSLPVQLLSELLERRGMIVSTVLWNAPRNDRPSRGRTVEQAADDCAAATAGHDYVVLVDEVLSGSRFLKLSGALGEKVDASRFIPVAMVFSDSSERGSKLSLRNRLPKTDTRALGWNFPCIACSRSMMAISFDGRRPRSGEIARSPRVSGRSI
ncbi:MAG: hypothetical protein ACLP19_27315 [Xanthobacteraceae bacterium]